MPGQCLHGARRYPSLGRACRHGERAGGGHRSDRQRRDERRAGAGADARVEARSSGSRGGCRRWQVPKTRWVQADVSSRRLEPIFAGADVVIHLAWLIQPSRDDAVLRARSTSTGRGACSRPRWPRASGALVHASSVGVYSPGPKDRPVDESWPRGGVADARSTRATRSRRGHARRVRGGDRGCGSSACGRG